MRLLYLQSSLSVNSSALRGSALLTHLRSENDVTLRAYVVPDSFDISGSPYPFDFIRESDLVDYDAIYVESGVDADIERMHRLPIETAKAFVLQGGQLIVADVDRLNAYGCEETLRLSASLLGGLPEYQFGGVCYLDDPAREADGTYRFFPSEMHVDPWMSSALVGIDSLLVIAPLALQWSGQAAATGHPSTRVLRNDSDVGYPVQPVWACATSFGLGNAAIVAAGISHDVVVHRCPDNARWISGIFSAMLQTTELKMSVAGPSGKRVHAVEEVSTMLTHGESAWLERKSTTRTDYPQGGVSTEVQHATAKSVAAMANGEGGHVIFGQADDLTVVGLRSDFDSISRKDRDGLEQWLLTFLSSELGSAYVLNSVKLHWLGVKEKDVLVVECGKSDKPILVTKQDKNGVKKPVFYVRRGNSTQPLEVQDMLDYAARRFN